MELALVDADYWNLLNRKARLTSILLSIKYGYIPHAWIRTLPSVRGESVIADVAHSGLR